MSPEENFHVVIRIASKRPKGFVEPPSVVWTNEMEQKLWQYISQKNTDWNVIAEQLGVPTSYIVRHAAFIYETQLRGIHQQLRINVNNTSMSRNSAKSPTPSLKRPTSVRYSDTFHQQEVVQESKTNESIVEARTRSPSQSLHKSSSSCLNTEDDNKKEEEEEEEDEEEDDDQEDDAADDDDDDEEEEFSSHFERMRGQVEEPAFLPKQLEGSLAASRIQISKSIQNLRKGKSESEPASPKKALSPQSTAPGSNNESAINSSTSSFSDISESSVTQSAMEDAFLSNFNHGSKL
ncbi:hypothetical protein HPULCUR_000193 [Helicostylum pulchrum]|uniref:Autophagy-related protein 29 n=1 Tax=Helicostylum pulchrum TaxID=562976 RepID=A0ABP9XKF0_9FUNG